MTQAENYELLADGGNKGQALHLAEGMCLWKGQDRESETTVYGFEDGSAIYASGPEFRAARPEEIAPYLDQEDRTGATHDTRTN
jgi:hypothetical protein